MLLAIDVGNTNTVLGLFDGDSLLNSWRTKTDARTTADEMVLTFRGLLADQEPVTGIALCSTVPAVLREMRMMLGRYFDDIPTVIVEPGIKTGVPVLT
ncbi:MAG: type III pantothenate kinase, partial [Actinobacteria bacterium]|nr:type III pantothenate kinase [Actinomycetota bacterium]